MGFQTWLMLTFHINLHKLKVKVITQQHSTPIDFSSLSDLERSGWKSLFIRVTINVVKLPLAVHTLRYICLFCVLPLPLRIFPGSFHILLEYLWNPCFHCFKIKLILFLLFFLPDKSDSGSVEIWPLRTTQLKYYKNQNHGMSGKGSKKWKWRKGELNSWFHSHFLSPFSHVNSPFLVPVSGLFV